MTDHCTQRRAAVLEAARQIAEKARLENRGLTEAEQDQIDSALKESRSLGERINADAKSQQLLGQLDSMARGDGGAMTHHTTGAPLLGLPGEGQRLAFGKAMAAAASTKILPPGSYGQKAVAPSGSVVVPQQFTPDPIPLGRPATSLLDVLPVQVQSSPQFAYLSQSVRTNNAAVVAEGAVKPASIYSVVLVQKALQVIAHLSEAVPRYWLIDSPQLQQFLEAEMLYGLQVGVEAKALADIAATSGIQLQTFSTSVLQTLLKSMTKCEVNSGAPASAFVLHPADFETIQLALLSVQAVEYQGTAAFEPVTRRLWGVPIALSVAVAAGTGWTFAQGAVAINTDSHGVDISWSETSNADDFSKNLIRARQEGRYATSVYKPLGVVKSAFS